ncbi:hypothetical protein F5Y11DRAFT_357239 [Daldinia sp. FL1419]|nr:hypothetical protein F5Y11DRAFT_357239 [Daldinia sp. FL1419]
MASTAASSFFQRIPAEVRRMILIEAFGDRIVHLDLRFDHPMVYLSDEEAQKQRNHCGIELGQSRRPKRDATRPKAWRWFSCVCHRDTESCVRGTGSVSEPYTDICLGGTARSCRGWRGEFPYKCFIGVMGWLLTCRQAYTEGIAILYSTNTFHISNGDMLHALPGLIRTEHRDMITSVELMWQLDLSINTSSGWDNLTALVRAVPNAFSGLRKLYVCLGGAWKPPAINPDDCVGELEASVLELMDEMVRKLGPQLQECNIAVPVSIFWLQRDYGIRQGNKFEPGPGQVSDRVWRPLEPLQEPRNEEGFESGYWIREGPDDIPFPFAHIISG